MVTLRMTVRGSPEALLTRSAAAKLAATSPRVRGWCKEPALVRRIRHDLAEEVDRVTDPAFAASLLAQCPFDGVTKVAAYNNRVLRLEDGALVLTGIRFRGLDLAKPFVDVIVSEGAFDADRLNAIAAQVEAGWAEVRPLCSRFPLPDSIDLNWSRLGPHSRPDLRVVAGRLDDLRSRPLVPTAPHVRLLRPDNLGFFDRYAKVYTDLFASHPKHREYDLPEDKAALAQALREGLLFQVLVDDRWAGIVSVVPEAPAGLIGFTVKEMLLDEAHRGRGFGPAMQQRLVERLRGRGDAVHSRSAQYRGLSGRVRARACAERDCGWRACAERDCGWRP